MLHSFTTATARLCVFVRVLAAKRITKEIDIRDIAPGDTDGPLLGRSRRAHRTLLLCFAARLQEGLELLLELFVVLGEVIDLLAVFLLLL